MGPQYSDPSPISLSPNFDPYGGGWFDTVTELAASVEQLTEQPPAERGAKGNQGYQGYQGASGTLKAQNGLPIPAITDALALNNTIYYSTTKQALVFKDSKGRVLKLSLGGG
jgi:hypothetical protein|tara:strand:+ start:475 stop:810 length:336 start_codon:yes stop_codon:yes gene_type:complete